MNLRQIALCLLGLLAVTAQGFVCTTSRWNNFKVVKLAGQARDDIYGIRVGSKATKMINRSSSTKVNAQAKNFFNSIYSMDKNSSKTNEITIIDPDFRVAILLLALGGLFDTIPYIQLTVGPLITALGVLVLVQTFRLRFVFDNESFSLVTTGMGVKKDDPGKVGDNVFVGGANRWATNSIINTDYFPKGWIDGPVGPILIYFKENQTPKEKWNEGPGKIANDPAKVEAGIVRPGQVHFFPAVANARQLREEFKKRGCKTM